MRYNSNAVKLRSCKQFRAAKRLNNVTHTHSGMSLAVKTNVLMNEFAGRFLLVGSSSHRAGRTARPANKTVSASRPASGYKRGGEAGIASGAGTNMHAYKMHDNNNTSKP